MVSTLSIVAALKFDCPWWIMCVPDHLLEETKMRRRFPAVAVVLTAAAVATPALADRPSIETLDLAGQQIACGETVLTFTDDAALTERSHEHALGGNRTRIVALSKLTSGHLVDENEQVYRVTGGRMLNLIPEGRGAGGHAHTRYVIRGHGLHGTVNLHVYLSESSDPVFRNNGTCTLV